MPDNLRRMSAVRRAFHCSTRVAPLTLFLLTTGCSGDTSTAPVAATVPAAVPAAPATTAPAPPYDMQFDTVQMIIKDQAFVIEIADEEAKVQRGLMYRKNMDASHGMLFVFDKPDTYSFWMKNTLIPLDIIYIDAKGKVLEIHDRKPLDETASGVILMSETPPRGADFGGARDAFADPRGAWRRGWDSNPRWHRCHAGFQDRCLKPLGHLSG